MTTGEEWARLITIARRAGYQVTCTPTQVILHKDKITSTFALQDTGRISGYMNCCVFLARQGIVFH